MKVAVADFPTDDTDAATREEWLNPWHIESAVGYLTWQGLEPVLWLELTLSSGVVRHALVGPVQVADLDTATEEAIDRFLA